MKKLGITLLIILAVVGSIILYLNTYKLDKVEVTGCVMSSAEEVEKAVRAKVKFNNTLELMLRNNMHPEYDVPFVAKCDIEYVSKNTVRAVVYEKSVAGCIEYMENYVYFDKDGIVLETSRDRIENVPFIMGMKIKSWQIGEELPMEDRKKFNLILNITQLIDKYELKIDGMQFTQENEIILFHDDIDIELGDGSNLNIQMMNLNSILQNLEGMSGVLYMKDFKDDTSTATFKRR